MSGKDPPYNNCLFFLLLAFILFCNLVGALERGDGSEWQQDCLASLLKLLCQLSMTTKEPELGIDLTDAGNVSGAKFKQRRKRTNNLDKPVPRLTYDILEMLNVDGAMARLTHILYAASMPRDPNHYKTGFWGRSQVVHYAIALLVSWVHSQDGVKDAMFDSENFSTWVKRLLLEDPEPAVRREVCTALYKLCLGGSTSLVVPMLAKLMDFLSVAETMGPHKYEVSVMREYASYQKVYKYVNRCQIYNSHNFFIKF